MTFRAACEADLHILIDLLYDDTLGATRETKDDAAYERYLAAFRRIQASQDNTILLAQRDEEIVGMLQLTIIPGLSHQGALRAQIENVRVKKAWRGAGIGRQLFAHAIASATQAGCIIVQLTTDRQRQDAIRFYKSLGFTDSHFGMKLKLK
ncbi:hypothetical protein AFK62_08435 [Cronobacter condimenti 1330]|uniref:N-acetyltransferase domain-containing protein n=1 Tax=Cronobacter condimenti 1330 TaxID=1073999 RepID=A0ABM5VI28_9ENTR|nr:hypothetical protein AFK62_08435 [Cronobacter condimenti 1330]